MAKRQPGKDGKKGRAPAVASDTELLRLEKIFQLMQRNQVQELEWEKDGERLRLKCQGALTALEPPQALRAPIAALPVAAAETQTAARSAEAAKPAASSTSRQITSPFVGTFYRAPSPTAEPYVREGQMVKRGDVLCIIEAMKLMNEIEAEASGKIVSVLVENGQPVEFGEPLFILEPAL